MKDYQKTRKRFRKRSKNQEKDQKKEDFITPLDFLEMGSVEETSSAQKTSEARVPSRRRQGVFVIGTDTGVGKTAAICALGALLKEKGWEAAAMKPVECGGDDARIFVHAFGMTAGRKSVSPYVFQERSAPYFLFKKTKQSCDLEKISAAYKDICHEHDITFVEGTGGLFDPLTDKYTTADMVRRLRISAVLVAPLRRGTVNHVIMAADHARELGVHILGVLFTATDKPVPGTLYQEKAEAVKEMARVPVLGLIPFFEKESQKRIEDLCRDKVDVRAFLEMQTGRQDQLKEWRRQHLWKTKSLFKTSSDSDEVMEHRKGLTLVNAQGKAYIDATSLVAEDAPAIELARRLAGYAPSGLERVCFSANGSAAVEDVLKIVTLYWKALGKKNKTQILRFSESCHGESLSGISLTSYKKFHEPFQWAGWPALEISSSDIEKFERYVKTHQSKIAAVMVEPGIHFWAGMSAWPDGTMGRIQTICRDHHVLLVIDERYSGLGRMGSVFSSTEEKWSPDIIFGAHGEFAGERPLGFAVTRQEIYKVISEKYPQGIFYLLPKTFAQQCRALLERLRFFDDTELLRKVKTKFKYFGANIRKLEEFSVVKRVRQKGLFAGIEMIDKDCAQAVCSLAREQGVLLGCMGNVLFVMPPVGITKKAMDAVLRVIEAAVKSVFAGGPEASMTQEGQPRTQEKKRPAQRRPRRRVRKKSS